MNAPASLPGPGELLAGKYRIERLLGRGGMGAVFAANHELLGRRVAIKVLLTDTAQSQEGLARFLNEARAAARLDSEHVARLMDFGALDNGLPFMVLEFLAGQDLGQVLSQRGPLPIPEVVDYVLQVCEALAQAHAAGIVHRDLKPSNLFLAQRVDGSMRIKVLDFGISKVSDPSSLTPKSLTSTRSLLGTPYYMSPEQLARPKEVDARTDVWQLGANIYELLTGAPPFMCDTLGELLIAIMNQPVPPLRAKRPDVSPEFEQVILRCLERDLSRRFASVAQLAEAIGPFGSGANQSLIGRVVHTLAVGPVGPVGPAGPSAPFGMTPGPGRTTGAVATSNAWGQASGAPPRPSSKTPVIVGATLVAAVGIAGGAVLLAMRLQAHTAGTGTISATTQPSAITAPPPPSDVPLSPPVASPAVTLAPPATTTSPPPQASTAQATPPDAATKPPRGWVPPARTASTPPTTPTKPAATTMQPPGTDRLPDNSRQ
jgi:serine/threonine-protein kinase